ncbi:MAG TPA: hypothetical protein VGK71_04570 [Nitrospirota bacterium]
MAAVAATFAAGGAYAGDAALAGTVTSVAGKGAQGYSSGGFSGDGGPALEAGISNPKALVADAAGNVYFIDYFNRCVRKIDFSANPPTITSIAGGGSDAFAEGVPAKKIKLSIPEDIAVDKAGNFYIADTAAKVILKVKAGDGTISRLAGNYSRWQVKDGVPALDSSLKNPVGVAVDGAGNVFIADEQAHAVRKVDAASGMITTVAGNGSIYGPFKDKVAATTTSTPLPRALAVDAAGNIYLIDIAGPRCRLRMVEAVTGVIRTLKVLAMDITHITADPDGNIYMTGGNRIYRYSRADGSVSPVAGTGNAGFSGDGGPALSAEFSAPHGTAVSGDSLFIADTVNNRIRRVMLK